MKQILVETFSLILNFFSKGIGEMRFGALSWRAFIHKVWLNRIWMSHWRHTMVDGAELWIGYKWPAFLSSFSCLQMIQNSAPFTIMWPQCDIRIQLWDIDIFVSMLTQKIQFDFTQPFSDSLKLKCKLSVRLCQILPIKLD